MAAGPSSTSACTRSGCCSAIHSATRPPNEVAIRLNRSMPSAATAAAIVAPSSGTVAVLLFSDDWPKPGISNTITR
jgi:hypothetical protein